MSGRPFFDTWHLPVDVNNRESWGPLQAWKFFLYCFVPLIFTTCFQVCERLEAHGSEVTTATRGAVRLSVFWRCCWQLGVMWWYIRIYMFGIVWCRFGVQVIWGSLFMPSLPVCAWPHLRTFHPDHLLAWALIENIADGEIWKAYSLPVSFLNSLNSYNIRPPPWKTKPSLSFGFSGMVTCNWSFQIQVCWQPCAWPVTWWKVDPPPKKKTWKTTRKMMRFAFDSEDVAPFPWCSSTSLTSFFKMVQVSLDPCSIFSLKIMGYFGSKSQLVRRWGEQIEPRRSGFECCGFLNTLWTHSKFGMTRSDECNQLWWFQILVSSLNILESSTRTSCKCL